MSDKDVFEKFDKFKDDIENLLSRIKETQDKLKDSLDKDNKNILLGNINEIQNSITEFKNNFISNLNSSITNIIEKANSSNIESLKQLQKSIDFINKNKTNNKNDL